jgi:tetrapyrrole methylase family protein/MazG family protein
LPDEAELAEYSRLRDVVARLRAPDGCPWDREQTHESLKHYLIQEAYEVIAALDDRTIERLPEELGDVLFQVLIHTQLAEEAGEFTMAEVLEGLTEKLVRRHPHVFGDVKLGTAGQVVEQWDKLKARERESGESALQGVPRALPALAYAQELLGRAARAGFEWPDKRDVVAKLAEEVEELGRAGDQRQRTEEFGDILINLVNYARYLDIDAEEALRLAANKFRRRFERVEDIAREEQRELANLAVEDLLAIWARAKDATREQ